MISIISFIYKNSGTVEPLIIATLAADQSRDLRQPLIAISQDISKALGSVSRDLKPLAFCRLGLPEEFGDMFATMDAVNLTKVLTAYALLCMGHRRRCSVLVVVFSNVGAGMRKVAPRLL